MNKIVDVEFEDVTKKIKNKMYVRYILYILTVIITVSIMYLCRG